MHQRVSSLKSHQYHSEIGGSHVLRVEASEHPKNRTRPEIESWARISHTSAMLRVLAIDKVPTRQGLAKLTSRNLMLPARVRRSSDSGKLRGVEAIDADLQSAEWPDLADSFPLP